MVVAFLLILLLSPVLPNAGIDNISHNVLHISYLKGRIIFAIIILIFYYKVIKTRPVANKIYSSLTLFLYLILFHCIYFMEKAKFILLRFLMWFWSFYLYI